MSSYQNSLIQEVACPICTALFTMPITLHCGHTFCRQCLIISTKNRLNCPMCRQDLHYDPQLMKIDRVLNNIAEKVKKHKNKLNKKRQKQAQQQVLPLNDQKQSQVCLQQLPKLSVKKIQNLILLDVQSEGILLPYSKRNVSFQLQHPHILKKLDIGFVVRQQQPYNKYCMIAKIMSLEQLRYSVYSCIIKVESFCKIEDQWIEDYEANGQQSFYRCCNVNQIEQNIFTLINPLQKVQFEAEQYSKIIFQKFLCIFRKIVDQQLLKSVYLAIEKSSILDNTNPIGMYYSIINIANIPEHQKYSIIITFDTFKRLEKLQNLVDTFYDSKSPFKSIVWKKQEQIIQLNEEQIKKQLILKNPKSILSSKFENSYWKIVNFFFILLIFGFLFILSQNYSSQGNVVIEL